jgi:hypothetical protein
VGEKPAGGEGGDVVVDEALLGKALAELNKTKLN